MPASDAHAKLRECAPFSAEYLFYQSVLHSIAKDPTAGLTFEEASKALTKMGQPLEKEWPYALKQPDPWSPPSITDRWFGALSEATADVIQAVSESIRNGIPVILGIRLSGEFLAPLADSFSIPAGGAGFGGHAVLAVGLGQDGGGTWAATIILASQRQL